MELSGVLFVRESKLQGLPGQTMGLGVQILDMGGFLGIIRIVNGISTHQIHS